MKEHKCRPFARAGAIVGSRSAGRDPERINKVDGRVTSHPSNITTPTSTTWPPKFAKAQKAGTGRTSNEGCSISWSLGARRSKKSSDHTTMACTREE
jgi:hypothetical protein